MRRLGLQCAGFAGAALLESWLTRSWTWPVVIPLVLPLLMSFSPRQEWREIVTLSVIAGLMKELWSGIAPGLVTMMIVLATCTVARLLRPWRSSVPLGIAGLLSGCVTALAILVLQLVTNSSLPARDLLAVRWMVVRLLIPGAVAGALVMAILWRMNRLTAVEELRSTPR